MHRCLIAVAVVLFAPLVARAQPLADRVPGDALIYAGWRGTDSIGPGYQQSHLKAIVDASNAADFINKFLPEIMGKAPTSAQDALHLLQELSLWKHPTAFYFGGVDMAKPEVRMALIVDGGADVGKLEKLLKDLAVRASDLPIPLVVTRQGTFLIVSPGPQPAVVELLGAEAKAGGLSAKKDFIATMAAVGKDPVAALYVDMDGIVKLIDANAKMAGPDNPWPAIRDGLGLASAQRIAWTAGFDGKNFGTQTFVASGGARSGFLGGMIDAKPLSDELLKSVPQSATVMAGMRFDIAALFKSIRDLAGTVDPNVQEQFDAGVKQVNDMLGMDLQKDVLATLGDEWAYYMSPDVGGGGLIGMVVVNRLHDPAKADQALTGLATTANKLIAQQMSDPHISVKLLEAKVGDLTIHYLGVPLVAPGWTVKGKNLYFGLYPQMIAAAAGHAPDKSILDNPAFVELRMKLGAAHPMSTVQFLDLPKTASEGYQGVLMMSRMYPGMADMFGVQSPPMLLPPLGKVLAEMEPAGSMGWTDAAGWHMRSISPFPGATMLASQQQFVIGEVALGTSILLPALNSARERAQRIKCGSNLRQIGAAILIYHADNPGKMLPDLGTLAKATDLMPGNFVCPSGDTSLPADLKPEDEPAWINANSDYIFLAAHKNPATLKGDAVVAYEKPGAHNGQGMEVLYGDGHVEWVTAAEAQRLIGGKEDSKEPAGAPKRPKGGL